jgi:hypothetical protein
MLALTRNVILAAAVVLLGSNLSRGEDPPATKPGSPAEPKSAALDQAALEKKFAEDMSGVVFAGSFSMTNSAGKESPAEMEKYTITRATKANDDYWIFQVRIQYGGHDVKIPLKLQVKWAGDTPMITLTDLTIPGLGTFTSRVLIYGDRYAGTWQHGKVGGHLWGRLEKVDPAKAESEGKGEQPKPSDSKKE